MGIYMSVPVGYTSPTGETDGLRPHSVRILELQALRKNRPFSAANRGLGSAGRCAKTRKEADRARPKLTQYRKEDLYDERMSLKSKANELAEENVRLKTRIQFLEKESKREDPSDNSSSLLSVLKAQCKDLKAKLDDKELAYKELKQSVKVTRAAEVQVELKAYIDECTRLRRMVEESAQQLAMGVAPADLQQRYLQLMVDYKALSREYRVAMNVPDDPKSRKLSLKDPSLKSNAALFELREENVVLREQNRSLVAELGRMQQLVCPNCQKPIMMGGNVVAENQRPIPLLFHLLWVKMKEAGCDVQTLWHKLDSEMAGVLRPQEIDEGFSQHGISLNPTELTQVMLELNPEQGTRVHFAQFEKTMLRYSLDPETLPPGVIQALMQLAWQCQVARVQKEEVPSLLTTGAECCLPDLVASLQQVPFSLSSESSRPLADFLLHGEPSQSSHSVSVWLDLLLPDWQVFTEEEEADLDRTLMRLFRGKYDHFLDLCKAYDPGNTQYIQFEEFVKVCEELGITVDGALMSYLQVEFYSETKDVEKVPYLSVAQLYCGGVQEEK